MKSVESWFESGMLSYLLNSLWQIPLLFAAGWVAARAMRRAGAAAEHHVWVGVLLLQSLLPASSAIPWAWMQHPWDWSASAHAANGASVTVQMGPGIGAGGWHVPGAFLILLAAAFGAATMYFAARFAWRCAQLSAMRRHATQMELSGNDALTWRRCETRFGIRGVALAQSSRIFAPVTMGIGRPVLLLPESMGGRLAEHDLLTVIAHEFAHIRRNDFLKNLAYELLSIPVSYHPLFRLTRERIMETREMVCDEMAAEMTEPIAYGRSLLRLASLLVSGMPARTPHAIGIFDANTLERRLMRLKEQHAGVRGVRRIALAIGCAAFAAGISASAVALSMHVDAAATDGKAAKTSVPLEVTPDKVAGNLITHTMPKYPSEAKEARIQGTVQLGATISKHGKITNLLVLSGPNELRQSALDAVRTWTYKPYLLNGKPVAVKTTINVIYSLQQ